MSEETITPAKYLVHWPGQDTAACDEHLRKLIGLGAVLGMQVAYTMLNDGVTECANCQSEHKVSGQKAEGPHFLQREKKSK